MPPHNVTIQGKHINITLAKIVYYCIHCLAPLRIKDFGLQCTANDNHYGFIHRKEAAELTQEERFMKISEMFKSDYLRGIDVGQPMRLTIKGVAEEMARNVRSGKMELEYVMYFKETSKKLRLNQTIAKQCALAINDQNPLLEITSWPGKSVTVYLTTVDAFAATHIVPRIRKTENGDKPPANGARFTTLEDMLFQINQITGLSEDQVRMILKASIFDSFTPSKSGEMYDYVITLVAEGTELSADEQPALIEIDQQPAEAGQ